MKLLRALHALLLTNFFRYSYSQIRFLSLPISPALAITTIILPLAITLSTQAAYRLRSQAFRAWPALYVALFAFQLIYETIIATLSLTYMVPNCGLEEQWARLFQNKDGDAIRRIQDRFNCCGLNSAVDRAWPFQHGRPEDGHGADQCRRMFGRDRPCAGPWGQAERNNAGLLFTVALVIFIVKVYKHRHARMRSTPPLTVVNSSSSLLSSFATTPAGCTSSGPPTTPMYTSITVPMQD